MWSEDGGPSQGSWAVQCSAGERRRKSAGREGVWEEFTSRVVLQGHRGWGAEKVKVDARIGRALPRGGDIGRGSRLDQR